MDGRVIIWTKRAELFYDGIFYIILQTQKEANMAKNFIKMLPN